MFYNKSLDSGILKMAASSGQQQQCAQRLCSFSRQPICVHAARSAGTRKQGLAGLMRSPISPRKQPLRCTGSVREVCAGGGFLFESIQTLTTETSAPESLGSESVGKIFDLDCLNFCGLMQVLYLTDCWLNTSQTARRSKLVLDVIRVQRRQQLCSAPYWIQGIFHLSQPKIHL